MSRTLDEALYRIERVQGEIGELQKLLTDLQTQASGGSTPPRPRPPATEIPQPDQPASTQHGEYLDRAASVGQKNALRVRAKHLGMREGELDAMVQRKFQKTRWNMITARECIALVNAIESGER